MPSQPVTPLEQERRVLEMVATGAPLRETLEAVAALIEAQEPQTGCAVLVVSADGAHFSESHGRGLPAAFHDAAAGSPVTPSELAGRAGPWRDRLAAGDFASVAATRLAAADGTMLGALAICHLQPGGPPEAHSHRTETAAHLATIALERARTARLAAERDARLQASARQFADLIENAPFGTYVIDADFRVVQASQSARAAVGIADVVGMDLGDALRKMWEEPFASEAIARFRHTLATGEPYVAQATIERRADIDAVEAYEWRIERIAMPDGRPGVVCYFYNLSDRLRMEAELRASEARFASAFEQAPTFMAMLAGPSHVFEVANPGFRKLVGDRELIGRTVADALPDAAAQGSVELLDQVWRTGIAYAASGARYAIQAVPGGPVTECFLDFVYQPIRDAAGAVARIFVEGFDVTERIRAEAKLAESESRFRLFIDRAPASIAMFDRDMRYLAASRRFLKDYGLPGIAGPEDLVGRSHDELFPGIRETWRAMHVRVLAGETLLADADSLVRPDGRTEFLRWEMAPWHEADGTVGGAVLFSEVVTARVESEAALAASEARFRAAVKAVDGVLWTNNEAGEMQGPQPGWEALTGQTQEEYQGYGWAKAVHPDDAEPTVRAWNQAVAAREIFVFEHRVRCRDNSWRQFSIRAIPVAAADGSIKEWVGVHTDITRQRQAEAVLARDNAQLEALVAERTRELEAAHARLAHVQRMEALGQLAGGIAHDFNNVLQAILGGAGRIDRRATDPQAVRLLARMMLDAAKRGSAITSRLLAFSRRGDLRAEALDPIALLTDLREILTHTLGAGIGVRVDASPGLPPLLADKGQLETVLINLATNARDAMGGNGVLTLAASAERLPRAEGPRPVAELQPGEFVRLAVSDTGIGMTQEVLARVTEPFFTTKPHGEGTGLGLAMARGFIEQSGGGMRIESEPGGGTTVYLWLPVAQAAGLPLAPPGQEETGRRGSAARLLVVDDDPVVRAILVAQLEAAGHTVLSAGDAQAALALLASGEPIDLLVSDLSMPGMDGIALVREVNRSRPKLPTILLTGFATNAAEIALSGALSGLFSLLRKPVSEQELAERVAMLLEGAEGGPAELQPGKMIHSSRH